MRGKNTKNITILYSNTLLTLTSSSHQVEAFELNVPFVGTADNIADFFTKPMKNATQFYNFRRIIMNEPGTARGVTAA